MTPSRGLPAWMFLLGAMDAALSARMALASSVFIWSDGWVAYSFSRMLRTLCAYSLASILCALPAVPMRVSDVPARPVPHGQVPA